MLYSGMMTLLLTIILLATPLTTVELLLRQHVADHGERRRLRGLIGSLFAVASGVFAVVLFS